MSELAAGVVRLIAAALADRIAAETDGRLMATLDEIAQLGSVEKDAARAANERHPEGSYRLGFLEGVLWERAHFRERVRGLFGPGVSPVERAALAADLFGQRGVQVLEALDRAGL